MFNKRYIFIGIEWLLLATLAGCAAIAPEPTPTPLPTQPPTETPVPPTATHTATPSPTNTPTATPTATKPPTPTPTPTPAPGDVLFEDDFSGEGSNWFVTKNPNVQIAQVDGVLRFSMQDEDFVQSELDKFSLKNVTIDVDVTWVSGNRDNAYGIFCRDAFTRSYLFLMTGNGYYSIWRWSSNSSYTVLQDWAWSSAFKTGIGQRNHITATCFEKTFSLSVNGRHLATTTDTLSVQGGQIALTLQTFEVSDTTVEFDNLTLSYPLEDELSGQVPSPTAAGSNATAGPPAATAPPAATDSPSIPAGEGVMIFTNWLADVGVQFSIWGPAENTINLGFNGDSRTLQVPAGAYGWTIFLTNGCRLLPADNLILGAGETIAISIVPAENECGAELQ